MTRTKRKTAIITMRLPPQTKETLQSKAADANMTLTDYLCICGLEQQIIRADGLNEVLRELKAQGRNLNQLTTLANMGRLTVLRGNELVDGYRKLCQQLSALTKKVT